MLAKVNDPQIHTETQLIRIDPQGQIFMKTLIGPRRSGRTAIYIHGGGGGGNHTLIERPSRRLIQAGLFDTILLPDRRGDGASSPLPHKYTIHEHAMDMKNLLDRLDKNGPLTAMGISYGGPIALGLAAIDPRIERVVLVASSPALSQNNGIARFLLHSGILHLLMKTVYRNFLGKLPPTYTDFDPAYDARGSSELVRIFTDALKRTPKEQLDSFLFSLEATLDEAHASLADDIRLSIPVIQIIGKRDEVWGSELLPAYLERFPRFQQYQVNEGKIHKDVFLKPLAFQQKMEEALQAEFETTQ
ncbi:MAG TPA: alpha/beta hydrolase, partial [Anaerolineaceae bacterium]|nr:alpha/beta hydrolase [Anaerolineaceae bacterium]